MDELDGSCRQDARQVQERLWFGKLWAFLKPADVNLVEMGFVRQNGRGKDLITTARLPDHLHQWVGSFKEYSKEERNPRHFLHGRQCRRLLLEGELSRQISH